MFSPRGITDSAIACGAAAALALGAYRVEGGMLSLTGARSSS